MTARLLGLLLAFAAPADAGPPDGERFHAVRCQGTYPKHLQGVCTDGEDALYWSFTDVLVKTDLDGKVVKKVAAADHHGDLCFHDGKVYAAVNLGRFNRPAGEADSWVYVYDADTLEEVARHSVPEVVHGAGGIACRDGTFLVVGGLPEGATENVLYEYDEAFRFRQRHVLPGYTLMGIQTAAYADGRWWFGCYGKPPVLLKADEEFRLVAKWEFDASLGIEGLPGARLLVGSGSCRRGEGCVGEVTPAVPDDRAGLRRLRPVPAGGT